MTFIKWMASEHSNKVLADLEAWEISDLLVSYASQVKNLGEAEALDWAETVIHNYL